MDRTVQHSRLADPNPREVADNSRLTAELVERINRILGGRALASSGTNALSPGLQIALLDEATQDVFRALQTGLPEQRRQLGSLLVEIRTHRRNVQLAAVGASGGIDAVALAGAIRRLRGTDSVAGLCRRVCTEAAITTNLDRVALSEIGGNTWQVIDVYPGNARDAGAAPYPTLQFTPHSAEDLAVNEQVAIIASTNGIQPAPELAAILHSSNYVVAPVVVSTGVAGLVHGAYTSELNLNAATRNSIEVFAKGFGMLIERAMLAERLDEQKKLVVDQLQREISEMDALTTEDLVVSGEFISKPAHTVPVSPSPPRQTSLLDDLTDRERDVFNLLRQGKSNNEIADELVISIFTVKTHVKRILRKLGATNRSAAVFHYNKMGE